MPSRVSNGQEPAMNDMNQPIRILLADDAAVIRESLIALLNRQKDMRVIAEATNGNEAIEQYRRYQPDITLMDVFMPEMDGIEAVKEIISEFPAACILMFSSYADAEPTSLQAGAKGFLLKDTPRQQLLETI